jgi:uncharacterized protein with LGFP repeats
MTGQQGRRDTVAGRAALGLLALATAFGLLAALFAPVAVASPLGDADDAITAAWKAAGGDHSDLGPKQGECYVAGPGFAQDFVHGRMFFTPATGPRSMSGAVLDKYEALGGPAASDLGFPTINEVPGLAGPDSRVSTFSASDKPVIFWTPAHGAFVVRGAINAAWDKLGSSGGALGVPVGDETYDGELATQAFSGGQVSWNRLTKAFTTVPPDLANQLSGLQVTVDPTAAINMAWRAAGGPSGALGAKQGDQYPVGTDGLAQNFAGGKVFFSPATGANAVESDILAKYESLGGPVGSGLGFPIANEADGGLKPASRISTFSAADRPVIFWTPDHGAAVVRGAMKAAWDKLGGPTGTLGAPLGDQTVSGHLVTQKFTGGQISWNKTNNTFSSQPANLASSLSGLQVPGQKMPATSAPTGGGGLLGQPWWRWLVVAIPTLLLAAIAVLAVSRWRRRRAARHDAEIHESGDAEESGYEAVTSAVSQWSPDADGDLAAPTLADSYRVPVRPRTVRLPSQSASDWMPPDHAALVDELLSDEIESTTKLSEVRQEFHEDFHQDFHEDLHEDLRHDPDEDLREDFPDDFRESSDEDPDSVDTAPTRIPTPSDLRGGRHAAADARDDAQYAPAPIAPGQLAIHLPMDDPYQVPDGYPVKANASFGLYYMPDNVLYDDTLAEIWFANEEIARANGFTKAG